MEVYIKDILVQIAMKPATAGGIIFFPQRILKVRLFLSSVLTTLGTIWTRQGFYTMQMNQAFIDRYTLNVVSSIEDQTALLVLDIQNHLTPSDMVPRLLAIQHYVLNALAQLDC